MFKLSDAKKKSCSNCMHFHSCDIDGKDPHGYCFSNPETIGYCTLWEGERSTTDPCEGWAKR